MQRNEYAITFVVRKVDHSYLIYVLTTDLNSIEDGNYEKRGRIICFELINSLHDESLDPQSSSIILKSRSIYSGEPTLIQRSEYKIEDGALYCMNVLKEKYLICTNAKISIFDVSNKKMIIHGTCFYPSLAFSYLSLYLM
jgi:hypothetical protein